MAVKICLLLLACATVGLAQILGSVPGPELGPIYTLQTYLPANLNELDRTQTMMRLNLSEVIRSSTEVHFEWENYDGWYNNPAHPEWGGAGKFIFSTQYTARKGILAILCVRNLIFCTICAQIVLWFAKMIMV